VKDLRLLLVPCAFLAGAGSALSGSFGCTVCSCPPIAEAPLLGTYVITDAPDPAAIGGTLEVVPAFDGAEDYRTLVIEYAATEGDFTVDYQWP
jgi:hypothetical protein